MTYLSARRMLSACLVSAAAVVALAAPGSASATDLTEHCAGSNIKGEGSTFQAPAQQPVWNIDFNLATDTNPLACSGSKKPTVTYESTEKHAGSGACLKGFGDGAAAKYSEFPFCGTDEAPGKEPIETMEANREGGSLKEGEHGQLGSVESIPVLQGAVAVIVHLPEFCKSTDVAKETPTGPKIKQGRLALDDLTINKIYRGEIKDWRELIAAQGAGHGEDTMTCAYPVLSKEEPFKKVEEEAYQEEAEKDTIKVVVRTDKSGTTHIFKSFLAQAEEAEVAAGEITEGFEAATFPLHITEENKAEENACKAERAATTKTWKDMQEGCENQRWSAAADITRPVYRPGTSHEKVGYKGNPGVVYETSTSPSSIGYADLAVAREENAFSANCEGAHKHPASECGGENKKGSELKQGEENERFWAVVQNQPKNGSGEVETYTEPSSDGDTEKAAESNCADTEYVGNSFSEPIPPESTREPWNTVKASPFEPKYGVCGLTYDLALREYKPYLEHVHGGPLSSAEAKAGKEEAQTVRDYLLWEVNGATDGGGYYVKDHDYEKLPTADIKKAEEGIKEIGWEEA